MAARLQDNTLKGAFLIVLFIILIFQTLIADAQSQKRNPLYRGFVASFGTHASELSSNLPQIDQASLRQAGGEVGLIFGNSVVRSKVGLLGYYSSVCNTAGTTDLYTSNVAANFYPLALILKRGSMVEPYVTGGLAYNQYKFFGYYVDREPGQTNYSQAEAPYLGKIKQTNATFGAGIEVKLKDDYDFIHLFSEVRYGRKLSGKSDQSVFELTNISNQAQVVIGITFGAAR